MKLVVGFILYEEASAAYLADFLPSLEQALSFLPSSSYRIWSFDNSLIKKDINFLALERFNQGTESSPRPRRPVEYSACDQNLGFSRAYNLMIRRAIKLEAEYFLVINPDTLLTPDSLRLLIAALDKDRDAAAAAPKIMRWDRTSQVVSSTIDSLGIALRPGLSFRSLGQGQDESFLSNLTDSQIIGPDGAAGVFRLSALEQIVLPEESHYRHQNPLPTIREHNDWLLEEDLSGQQYFDERFFMYKEDCDLAYRLFLADFKTLPLYQAVIYHDRTAFSDGGGLADKLRSRRLKTSLIRAWSFRNQHIIFLKYYFRQNILQAFLILLKSLFFFIFALILEQFLLKEYSEIWARR